MKLTLLEFIMADNLGNPADFASMHYMGMMQDFQRQRIQIGDGSIIAQQRLTGGLENACVRGIRPFVEPNMSEMNAIVKGGTGIDPTSQAYHMGNSQVLAGIAETNSLIRSKMEASR